MAFNGVGRIFLKFGASTWVNIYYPPYGSDMGAQWIMAHPEMNVDYPHFGTAQFEVGRFTKRVYFAADTGQQYVSYWCEVTNNGDLSQNIGMDIFFSMQGGGNT